MLPRCVVITPARNEAQFIELTIRSVVKQTVVPLKWIIVSDGSTDGTDEIVRRYAAEYPWIELVRMPEHRERNFAGKVLAFDAGRVVAEDLDYEIIGNLDADISFDDDYLGSLLGKFEENPKLGVAGTAYEERNTRYDYRFSNLEHVPGAFQLFRRQCFQEIGGYMPIKGGCVDTIASMAARMKGWQARTFTDKSYVHHRESGTAGSGALTARFKRGEKGYAVGNHPIWELFRTVYQMTKRPFIIGGLALLSGYLWAFIRSADRPVPPELVAFQRREQMRKLGQLFTGGWIFGR